MPFLLRKIAKAKWFNDAEWLCTDDIQADALVDLRTQANKLSVWYIEDDESNLQEVVVALGANYDKLDKLDYALVNQEILMEIGIKVLESEGDTRYKNGKQWHRDLIELTAEKILEVAKTIKKEKRIKRVNPKQLRNMLLAKVKSGELQEESLNTKLKDDILK